MNQIAIFGVALLIAYTGGIPVDEQTTGNPAINELEFISANLSVNSMNTLNCSIQNARFIGIDVCVFVCGNLCNLSPCGGFESCRPVDPTGFIFFECHCKNSKPQSSNEAARTLINNNEGKAPKDFLSALAKNEQNGEVAANH